MAKEVVIRISAQDAASPVFKKLAGEAAASGASIETTNQRTAKSYEDLQKKATAVGAGIGAVVAGLSLAGQAAVQQQQQVRGVEVAYGTATQEMLRFADQLQATTNYSNDAARQSEIYASSLIQNYGLAGDQITQLIQRSADLATVNVTAEGTQIALTDAVSRASAAIRGEAEAGELLGLSLSDTYLKAESARRGIEGWSTTMTEAEKAQFRFTILMEQSNYAMGEAERAHNSARGAVIGLTNDVQDSVAAFGEWLGPMGEALSMLGQMSLLLPVVGGMIGKLGTGLSAAGFKPGMIGPAALIAGGASLAYGYAQEGDGTTATNTFWNNFFMQASGMMNALLPGNPYDTKKYTDQMDFNEKIDVLNQLFRAEGESQDQAYEDVARLLGLGRLDPNYYQGRPAGVDASKYVVPSKEEIVAEIEQRAAASGMGMNDYLQQQAMAGGLLYDPGTRTYVTRDQRLAGITGDRYIGSPGTSGLERAAGSNFGPAAPYFPFRGGANPQADYLAGQAEIQAIQGQIDTALIEYLHSGAVDAIDLLRAAYPGAPINRMRGAVGGFSYSAEDGTTVGSGFYGRTAEDGTRVPQEFYAPQPNYTPFDVQAERAGQARSNFQTGYNVTIGQTQGMASDSQGLADFTMGLVNEEGVLGQWDDLVSRGVIDTATQQWASYAEVQGEANRIFATNAEIQDDVAVIQLKQLGYMADLQAEYGKTIDEISKMDEAEQRRTLAMMDSSEQAKVSEAATIAYRVATGELSESIGTDLIKGMAMADPLFADLAEQYGLISYGAEGEIIVNFPDKDSLIEGVGELNDNLANLIELLANYFEINITSNAGDQAAELAGIVSLLNGLDGQTATFYVNEVRTGISIGNPSGPSITPLSNGGTVYDPLMPRFANGGTWAMVGERGPEMVYLSRGDQVFNTEATRSMAGQRRGNTYQINGPLTVVANDPRQFGQALREAAVGGSR